MSGIGLPTRLEMSPPKPASAPKTIAPATPPAMAPTRTGGLKRELSGGPLNFDHLQVFHGAGHRSRVHVVEEETRVGMAFAQLLRRLPAHVAENVSGACRLDDGDVGVVDELVQRSG